jgi:hypothetical protein
LAEAEQELARQMDKLNEKRAQLQQVITSLSLSIVIDQLLAYKCYTLLLTMEIILYFFLLQIHLLSCGYFVIKLRHLK